MPNRDDWRGIVPLLIMEQRSVFGRCRSQVLVAAVKATTADRRHPHLITGAPSQSPHVQITEYCITERGRIGVDPLRELSPDGGARPSAPTTSQR
jgi:hypothetical protein